MPLALCPEVLPPVGGVLVAVLGPPAVLPQRAGAWAPAGDRSSASWWRHHVVADSAELVDVVERPLLEGARRSSGHLLDVGEAANESDGGPRRARRRREQRQVA